MVCFLCGEGTTIEPIRGCIVNFVHFDDASFEKSPSVSVVKPVDVEQFVGMLITLGYIRSKAKSIVNQCLHEYTGDDAAFTALLVQKGTKCVT